MRVRTAGGGGAQEAHSVPQEPEREEHQGLCLDLRRETRCRQMHGSFSGCRQVHSVARSALALDDPVAWLEQIGQLKQ